MKSRKTFRPQNRYAVFACFIWLAITAAAVGDEPWRVRDVATDGTGETFAVQIKTVPALGPMPKGETRRLGRFTDVDSTWWPLSGPFSPGQAFPERLVVLSDGKVACLWTSKTQTFLTLHRRYENKAWCSIHATFTQPRLLPLSDGGLLITEHGVQVAHIPADGVSLVLRSIPEDLISDAKPATFPNAPPPPPQDQRLSMMDTRAVEGGDGSLWLWTWSQMKMRPIPHLRSFIRWTPDGFESLKNWPFGEKASISAVVADGKEHLYVTIVGDGLKRLHLPDGKAVPFQSPDAFANISSLTWVNGSLHVVTCLSFEERTFIHSRLFSVTAMSKPNTPVKFKYVPGQRIGDLWRLDGAGPRLLIHGLDARPAFGENRSILASASGLLVTAEGSAPWWLPADGSKPFLIDESQGLKLIPAVAAVPLGKDQFLARAANDSWAVAPLPGSQPTASTSRRTALQTRGHMVPDSRWHLWTLRADEGDLADWDGHKWTPHRLPEELKDIEEIEFAGDSHDHGWLLPKDNGRTAVVDFLTAKWRFFNTQEEAVTQVLTPGDQVKTLHCFAGPRSSATGSQGFLTRESPRPGLTSPGYEMHVCQGGKWSHALLKDITGGDERVSTPPFFDDKGVFRQSMNSKSLKFGPDNKWLEETQPDLIQDPSRIFNDFRLPPECPVKRAQYVRLDRFGVAWIRNPEGQYWKWLDGVVAPVHDADGSDPVPVAHYPGSVIIDAAHNALIYHTSPILPGVETYDLFTAKPPPSVIPATLATTTPNTALVHLSPAPGTWQRWRLDNSRWQRPIQQPELKIEGLNVGPHQLFIQTFDDELTPVGEIQTIPFTMEAAGEQVFAAQLHQLQSDDLAAREAAARLLKAQGSAALPRLNQALKNPDASPSLQWWLHAIIQQIQAQAGEGR